MPSSRKTQTTAKKQKRLQIPAHKLPVREDERHLYDYVEDRADLTAREIASMINESFEDEGGIVYVHGPLHSGKTLTALKVSTYLSNDISYELSQPQLERPDVVEGYFYSKSGKKRRVVPFSSENQLKDIFDYHDVVIIDEVMFIPYKMQSFFLKEVERFKESGGWFVGFGLLHTGIGTEFLLSSILNERADRSIELQATCQKCGRKNAIIGQRLVNGRPASVGDPELLPPSDTISYEPRCIDCYIVFS